MDGFSFTFTSTSESLTFQTAYFSLLVSKLYILRYSGHLLTQQYIFHRYKEIIKSSSTRFPSTKVLPQNSHLFSPLLNTESYYYLYAIKQSTRWNVKILLESAVRVGVTQLYS